MVLSRPFNNAGDPLSDVLATLEARSVRRTRLEASGAWALTFQAVDRLKFVAVLKGWGWMLLPGRSPIRLTAGDVCLIGRTAYTIASAPELPPADGTPLFEGLGSDVARLGGDETVMLGGGVAFAGHAVGFLLDSLPDFALISASSGSAATVTRVLGLLEVEVGTSRLGSVLVAARLAEILLVEAIRVFAERHGGVQPGWIGALADPQMGQALRLMHGNVAHHWTVKRLASEVGMSRSAFAAGSSARVGRPPLDYLRHWRMVLAQSALRAGTPDIAEVAERVGYTSQSAFSHAYRRSFGQPPGQTR